MEFILWLGGLLLLVLISCTWMNTKLDYVEPFRVPTVQPTANYRSIPSDMNFWGKGGCTSSPNKLAQCANQYSIQWGNDPLIYKKRCLSCNPFAKKDGSHCRSNSQCQSGYCRGWFCSPSCSSNNTK